MKKKVISALVIGLIAIAMLSGCQGRSIQSAEPAENDRYYTTDWNLKAGEPELFIDVTDESGQPVYTSDTGAVTQQVIRRANLSLEVDNMEVALQALQTLATETQGFIQSSSLWESNGRKRGSYSLRIPASEFMEALSRIQEIGKVVRLDQSAQDVTEEYIDLTARLRTLEAKQETYLSLLDKAETIEDILRVEEELDRVMYEIERTTGRVQYLERNVSMSTIDISIAENQPQKAQVNHFGSQLKYALQDGFGVMIQMTTNMIGQIFWLIPFIPIVLILFIVIKKIVKAIQKRKRDRIANPKDKI